MPRGGPAGTRNVGELRKRLHQSARRSCATVGCASCAGLRRDPDSVVFYCGGCWAQFYELMKQPRAHLIEQATQRLGLDHEGARALELGELVGKLVTEAQLSRVGVEHNVIATIERHKQHMMTRPLPRVLSSIGAPLPRHWSSAGPKGRPMPPRRPQLPSNGAQKVNMAIL